MIWLPWVVTLAAVLLAGCSMIYTAGARASERQAYRSMETAWGERNDAVAELHKARVRLADAERRARRRQSRAALPQTSEGRSDADAG